MFGHYLLKDNKTSTNSKEYYFMVNKFVSLQVSQHQNFKNDHGGKGYPQTPGKLIQKEQFHIYF